MKKGVPVILLLFVFIFACDEKQEELIAPFDPVEINILNLSADETYRNELTVKVELSKTDNISKVELYANDSYISADDTSPYELTWNTLKGIDGNKELKVVIYDRYDNKQETSMNVIVENSLLRLSVLDYYSTNNSYIILSDDEGGVLYSGSIAANMEENILPEKPYEKDNINVTVVDLNEFYSETRSYIDIKRGAQWQLGFAPQPTTEVNQVTLHLKNSPPFTSIRLVSMASDAKLIHDLEVDTLSGMTLPYQDDAKIYIELEKEEGKYFKLMEISSNNMDIDLQAVDIPLSKRIIALPEHDGGYFHFAGRYMNNNEIRVYAIAEENILYDGDRLSIEYPGDPFHSYYVDISISGENGSYNNLTKADMPAAFEIVEADINVSNGGLDDFEATFKGDFDYYKVQYSYNTNASYYNAWWVLAPAYKSSFKLPEISTIVNHSGLELQKLSLNRVDLNDSPDYADQPGSFKFYESFPSPVSDSKSYSRIFYYPQ